MATKADDKVTVEQDLESKLTKTILNLEEIDINLYRGTNLWRPVGGRAVFGGQVVGQALVAAGKTKPDDVHVHSLHCYFIRRGVVERPILYHVDKTRNGSSFYSRQVEARQSGKPILSMLVSYHRHEPAPFQHQYTMPQATPPEQLASYDDLLREVIEKQQLTEKQSRVIRTVLAQDIPIDVRPVDPYMYARMMEGVEPRLLVWMKAKGHIGTDNNINRCVAAYLSDWALLRTAIIPYPRFQATMMASLDHSMWFHSHFRADEWMLYDCESPRSVGARSLTFGRLWKRDGTLAVSVAQEGVVRGKMHQPKL